MMNNVSTALEYAEDSLKADPEVMKIAVSRVAEGRLRDGEDCCGQSH